MSRYGSFDRLARDTAALVAAYRKTSREGGGNLLLEDGTFVISRETLPDLDSDVDLTGHGSRCATD